MFIFYKQLDFLTPRLDQMYQYCYLRIDITAKGLLVIDYWVAVFVFFTAFRVFCILLFGGGIIHKTWKIRM